MLFRSGAGYRLDGHTGCNGIGGDYNASADGQLGLANAMGSTDRSCSDAVLAIEDAMTMGLSSATAYSIDRDMLTITFDGGSMTEIGRAMCRERG